MPRRNVVLNVFELLDNNKIGEVNIEDIRSNYYILLINLELFAQICTMPEDIQMWNQENS